MPPKRTKAAKSTRAPKTTSPPDLSIVVPAYNEVDNVPHLHRAVTQVMSDLRLRYEFIIIDDGSRDGTFQRLAEIQKRDKNLTIIRFRRNFGQTAAMDAGFKAARGRIIITLDADLQNDPVDIPRLIEAMHFQNVDVVSGWRWPRRDPLTKRIFSKLANRIRKAITGERIHDSGCTLKAFKRECFNGIDLQGEMHRYIPAILQWRGFRIGEIKVRHHSRKFGRTKYSAKRIFRGFLDLLVVKFWMQYSTRPIQLFGSLGIIMFALGFLTGIYLTVMKIFFGAGLADRPLLLLTILLIILGVQFIAFGLLADILVKMFYRGNPNYNIEEIRRK